MRQQQRRFSGGHCCLDGNRSRRGLAAGVYCLLRLRLALTVLTRAHLGIRQRRTSRTATITPTAPPPRRTRTLNSGNWVQRGFSRIIIELIELIVRDFRFRDLAHFTRWRRLTLAAYLGHGPCWARLIGSSIPTLRLGRRIAARLNG